MRKYATPCGYRCNRATPLYFKGSRQLCRCNHRCNRVGTHRMTLLRQGLFYARIFKYPTPLFPGAYPSEPGGIMFFCVHSRCTTDLGRAEGIGG